MILVGRGTYLADQPKLDVRLPGLEDWSPRRALLTRGEAVDGWEILASPQDVYRLHDVNDLLVEGGSATATAFLAADLVDRILIYRAPILVGEGKSSVRLYRPRRDRRRPRPLAGRRRRARLASTGSKFTSGSATLGARPMFTGIITDIGTVRSVEQRGDLRLTIGCGYDLDTVDLGASIACSGVCLTVVDKGDDWFAVDVSRKPCRAPRRACGPKAPGSTSSARCGSATSSAAISSPAMSMRSATVDRRCRGSRRQHRRHDRRAARAGRRRSRPRARSRSTACR